MFLGICFKATELMKIGPWICWINLKYLVSFLEIYFFNELHTSLGEQATPGL